MPSTDFTMTMVILIQTDTTVTQINMSYLINVPPLMGGKEI